MSVSPEQSPEPRSLRGRFNLSIFLYPWFQRALLAVFVSCFVSFLMIDYVRLPSLNLQVGDIAEHNVRAAQKFEFTDQEATRQRRELAEGAVRPVFDFDSGASRAVTGRVRAAFASMRKQLADVGAPVSPGEPDETRGDEGAPRADRGKRHEKGTGAAEGSTRRIRTSEGEGKASKGDANEEDETPARSGLAAFLTPEKRREFSDLMGLEIAESQHEALVFLAFASSAEDALVALIESAMKSPIISDRGALPSDMSSDGIVVMRLGEDARDERLIYDRDRILDLPTARTRVKEVIAERFSDRLEEQKELLASIASRLLHPTVSYNAAQTALRRQQARVNVQPVTYQIKKGTMVVRAGDPIDGQKLLFLHAIAQAKADYNAGFMFASMAFLILLVLTACYVFAATYIRKFSTSIRDLITASILLIFVVALTRVTVEIANALSTYIPSIPLDGYFYGIPLACGAMVVRILMNSETSLVFALVASLLAAMLVDYNVFYLAFFFISSLAAAGGISHTRERVHVLRGGLVASGCNLLMVFAIFFIQSNMVERRLALDVSNLPFQLWFAFIGGLASAVLALGVVPFFEMFGYVTDYKLLELANLNHPLLKDLMVRAPGTYHHSVIVGTLSEAAAQAVRANALLARVGCYYHDIGKMRKAEFFIENLRNVEDNPHDRMSPEMSARVIAGHVRDGIEMGRQHKLPQAIIDLIPQHHGTSLISFFYNKARQTATDADMVHENDYRYPGPRPQTREAGIVMLADATEASTRSIKQVNAAKIRMNLQKIFQRVISDGQLDECPLTLKDLAVILESFHRTLLGIYHNRIEYPPDFRPGASVAGEGTGAVLTLESDTLRPAAPATPGFPGRRNLPEPSRAMRPDGDLMATTTADPIPAPTPVEGVGLQEADQEDQAPKKAGASASS